MAPVSNCLEAISSAHSMVAEEEITLSPESTVGGARPPSIFAWALEESVTPVNSKSAVKLLAIMVLGIVMAAVLLFFVANRSWSMTSSSGAFSQKPAEETQPAGLTQPSVPLTQAPKPSPTLNVRAADLELEKIKSGRVDGGGSDRKKILRELKTAETHYPDDYRFPYERARLSINSQDTHSHHEAFDAMMRAAQKAIEDGKADEMLASLTSDKDADFSKLSRGHSEWKVIEQALRDKDKSKLNH